MTSPLQIRLGVAPIAWSNSDLPELGGDISLETCLRESRAAGYVGTENGAKFPETADELAPLLREHALELISGWFSGRLLEHTPEAELERLRPAIALYTALGAEIIIYAETSNSIQVELETPLSERPIAGPAGEDSLENYAHKLSTLAEAVRKEGLGLSYHPHMGTIIQSAAEIDLLMAHSSERVGLLLDTGHLCFAEEDPLRVLQQHAARVNHVHFKDVRAEVLGDVLEQDQSFLGSVVEGVFTVPGDGHIDFHSFARALHKSGYAGWVVVEAEQDPVKAEPLHYVRMGLEHSREALSAAGYQVIVQPGS